MRRPRIRESHRAARLRAAGFTLIEMITVIVLTGALFAAASIFIVGPMQAYADLSRRARLVDIADQSLRRMARDLRRAVPNTVRTASSGTVTSIGLLHASSGGRYRAAPSETVSDPAKVLEFDRSDTAFEVIGGFPGVASLSSSSHHLIVYNLGAAGSDAYQLANVITPPGTALSISGSDVSLSPGFRFAQPSPEQRVFLSDGEIVYHCQPNAANPASGVLRRQQRSINASLSPTAGVGDVVSTHISACSFQYTVGSASRSAVVSLRLSISEGGETISLLRQVHVDNAP
jgi:MSHA biogenesis protein MshO